jgi:hypothetical protein
MQDFQCRPKARAREKEEEFVDAYEMLNDSPQPHCSAEDDVSNLVQTNRFVY